MSDITPLRRWLPLSDAVKQISERLDVPTEDARRALFNALTDEITQARGHFWDGSNDRIYLEGISLHILLNSKIDWDKNVVVFNEPMRIPPDYDLICYEATNVEVYRDNLDEWLKAHRSREPSKSHDKGTDVASEAASTTRPTPSRRRKGGPKPGPYLSHLRKFLNFLLEKKGPHYFVGGIGAIEDDVRNYFKRDEFKDKVRLPKSRSGLQDQIKKWKDENVHLD